MSKHVRRTFVVIEKPGLDLREIALAFLPGYLKYEAEEKAKMVAEAREKNA